MVRNFFNNVSEHLYFEFFFGKNSFKPDVFVLKDFEPFGFVRGHAFEFLFPFLKGASRNGILTTYLGL